MVSDDDIGFELLDTQQFQKYALREIRQYRWRGIPIETIDIDDLLIDAGNDGVLGIMATILTYGIIHATHGRIGFARIVTQANTKVMGFGTNTGVWLGEIYITYDHRRKGYARRVINDLHVTYVIVEKDNLPACRLYMTMGFKELQPAAKSMRAGSSMELSRTLT